MKKSNYKLSFLRASILMIIYAIVGVLFAFILEYITNSVSSRNKTEFFQYLIIGFIVTISEFLFSILSRFYTLKYVRYNLEDSKNRFYWYILNKQDNKNEMDMAMFSSNVDILYQNYYINKVLLVYYVAKFILSIYAVIYLNWIVFLVAFFTSLIPLIIPQIFSKKVQNSVDNYSLSSKAYLDFISDSMLGSDEIKSYNNQEIFFKNQCKTNSIQEHSRAKSKLVNYFISMLSSTLGSLTFLATIAVSGYFVIKGSLTIGAMIAIIQLLNSMVSPLIDISSCINEINSAKNIVKQYNVTLDEDVSNKSNIDSFKSNIIIDQLSYSYDSNNTIINNFSYKFEKNKKYAIVGESGSGKSTLGKLISGNIIGYSGKILIDGEDLNTINLKSYREVCRYVNQQSYIFKDTIKNNILFYDKTEKSIDYIINMFNLKELIEKIGLNKVISDNDGVSGGQKQRIILSRALLRETPILILDEPTSSLDFKNSLYIINELTKIQDLTLIMITHEHDQNVLNLFDEVITIK